MALPPGPPPCQRYKGRGAKYRHALLLLSHVKYLSHERLVKELRGLVQIGRGCAHFPPSCMFRKEEGGGGGGGGPCARMPT